MSPVDTLLAPAWRRTDQLFGVFTPEALRARALPLRHPPIFYLGHLPAFAWNQVARGILDLDPIDAELEELFERGIDPLSDDAAEDAAIQAWPDVTRILDWRDTIRQRLPDLVEAVAAKEGDPLAHAGRVWHMVHEHELMHHETLLYIMQQVPVRQLRRPSDWPRLETGGTSRPPRTIPVFSGPARLGTTLDDVPFAWDNEIGPTEVHVETFLLDDVPVTVGRFADFVEAGGYGKPELWSDDGWSWREAEGREAPEGWRATDDGWSVRSLFAWHPIDEVAAWPVQVSHAEAAAFATWVGGRLPSEAELHRATWGDGDRSWPWGEAAPTPRHANLDFRSGGPRPAGRSTAGRGPFGHMDLIGNLWEWTATPFRPLDGFEPWIRTYPGYSADFFDDAHHVVGGASWATADRLARRSFRNWYQRHYPYVFAGFRLAWDA